MSGIFLTTAEDLSESLKLDHNVELSPERIEELAIHGDMPYFKIDGGKPMFDPIAAKDWVLWNVLERYRPAYDGPKPELFDSTHDLDVPTEIPECLQRFTRGLKEFPLKGLAYGVKVYFLVSRGKVIYIGKTDCFTHRLSTHLRGKKFDRVFFLDVHPDEAADVEFALIRTIKPKMNSQRPYQVKGSDYESILARHTEA